MPKKEKVQVEVEVKSKKISVHHAACPMDINFVATKPSRFMINRESK